MNDEAEEIVRALAAKEPVLSQYTGGTWYACAICFSTDIKERARLIDAGELDRLRELIPITHTKECAFLRACEWVAAHPRPARMETR